MSAMALRRGSRIVLWTAIAAVLVGLFLYVYARRRDAKPQAAAVDPASPESYMHDKEFRGKLAKERKEHVALIRDRNAIAEKMKAMIEAKKAELKTDDLKVVQSALEEDPAWKDLYAQCTNANAKVEAHGRDRLRMVRERITPRQPRKAPVSK